MPQFSLVGFAIEALLITNIFVFFYSNAVRLLNSVFPAANPTEFIRIGALPEPFEISLYLFFSFISVLVLLFFHKYFKKESVPIKKTPLIKYLVLIFLVLLFISNLGTYPLSRMAYPYQVQESKAIYLFYFFIYVFITSFVVLLSYIFRRYIERNAKRLLLFFIFIVGIIALATFEPRFPIYGHDYSYFFGPIWEVVHGKTLYTQVPSQYGFLSILFFSLLYKIQIFDITSLRVLVWIFYILQYSLCFYLVYKISRSLTLSVTAVFSLLTVNYFSIYHLPAAIPQTGPLRWLPIVLSVFFLYKLKNITSPRFILILALLSLWIIDSGISLILSYGFTLFLLALTKQIDQKKFIRSGIFLVGSLFGIFFIINAFHLIFGYKPVDIISVFVKLQQYAKAGFGMLPLDLQTYFWVVMLIYFASIIYFLRKIREANNVMKSEHTHFESFDFAQDKRFGMGLPREFNSRGSHKVRNVGIELLLLLFSANLSLFASVYFVGRSHPHNLFHISILPLLNAFLLFGFLFKQINSNYMRIVFALCVFLIFVVFPIYNRQEVMTLMVGVKNQRFMAGEIFTPEWKPFLEKKYESEVGLIKNSLPEREILILSPDDTYLFYLTGKANLMNDNSQITILTKKDMEVSLKKVFERCPQKIVADCTLFDKCTSSKPFTIVAFFSIQPVLLNRIQEVCKVSYQPITCTNQLCIAEVKK